MPVNATRIPRSLTGLLAIPLLAVTLAPGVSVAAPSNGGCAGGDRWFVFMGDPGYQVGSLPDVGAVHIAKELGLNEGPGGTITPGAVGLTEAAGARFGASVAPVDGQVPAHEGNWQDAGQCTQLLVGSPGANEGRGAVYLVTAADAPAVALDLGPLALSPGDALGTSVVSEPVTGGTILAAGAPGRDVGTASDAGMVVTWYLPSGGVPGAPTIWTQGAAGLPDQPEPGDHFGAVMARTGPLWVPLVPALTIGVPDEDIASAVDAGAVLHMLFERSSATLASARMDWEGATGVPGRAEPGDHFGAAVEGGGALTAVGIPGKKVHGKREAGAVLALNCAGKRLKLITQDSPGVPDRAEAGDHFGASLVWFRNEGYDCPLVVGAPGEDRGATPDVGSLTYHWVQTRLRYKRQWAPTRQAGEQFGASMAGFDSGSFDSTNTNLLVGAPGADVDGMPAAGRIFSYMLDSGFPEITPGLGGAAGNRPGARLGS